MKGHIKINCTMNKKIAIIGTGNIGTSIASGMIKSGLVPAENIFLTRRNADKLSTYAEMGAHIGSDNKKAIDFADIVIVAVKPKKIITVLDELKLSLDSKKHTLVSVVTGFSINQIKNQLDIDIPVFRIMPNTAASVCESMTFVAGNQINTPVGVELISLLKSFGDVLHIDEELMQAGTVLGACGIAFALRYIRASQQAGVEIGFDAETAQRIATQTVKGAAVLLLEGGLHPEREIDKVTTPQGITIAGLNEMEHQGFSSALIKGISLSHSKIVNVG